MDAKPFTFDSALIPLVLDGRKTQSRRLDRKFEVGDVFRPTTPGLSDSGKCIDRRFAITRVWLEPVREISNADALAEGIRHCDSPYYQFGTVIERYYPGIWLRNGLVWAHAWRPAC